MTWAVTAAAVSAAGSIYSASESGRLTGNAADRATQAQQAQLDYTRQTMAPYQLVGNQALNRLAGEYGFQTPSDVAMQAVPDVSGSVNKFIEDMKGVLPTLRDRTDQSAVQQLINAASQEQTPQNLEYLNSRIAEFAGKLNNRGLTEMFIPMRRDLDALAQVNYRPTPTQTATQGQAAPQQGSMLTQDPGYQFRLQEGQNALQNNLLARGMGMSGAQIKAGQQYSQGLASQEYQNAFNRLASLAGMGQGATQSVIGQGGQTASNIGNIAMQQGTNQANIGTNLAQNLTGIAASTAGNLAWQNAMTPPPPSHIGMSNAANTILSDGRVISNPGATVTYSG